MTKKGMNTPSDLLPPRALGDILDAMTIRSMTMRSNAARAEVNRSDLLDALIIRADKAPRTYEHDVPATATQAPQPVTPEQPVAHEQRRDPGRPSAKNLVLGAFRQRAETGAVHLVLAREAGYLLESILREHPQLKAMLGSTQTVKNHIREDHKRYRERIRAEK